MRGSGFGHFVQANQQRVHAIGKVDPAWLCIEGLEGVEQPPECTAMLPGHFLHVVEAYQAGEFNEVAVHYSAPMVSYLSHTTKRL